MLKCKSKDLFAFIENVKSRRNNALATALKYWPSEDEGGFTPCKYSSATYIDGTIQVPFRVRSFT